MIAIFKSQSFNPVRKSLVYQIISRNFFEGFITIPLPSVFIKWIHEEFNSDAISSADELKIFLMTKWDGSGILKEF